MVFDSTKGQPMKKKNPALPPATEWDFRQVDRILLRDAAEYEYARTCDNIRVPLVRWLDTRLKGKLIRQHIIDAGIKRQAEAQKAGAKILGPLPDCHFPSGVLDQIFEAGQRITPQCFYLYEAIAQYRPDFPNPWTSSKVKGAWNENFKRVHLRPMDQELRFFFKRAEEWPKGGKDYLEKISRSFLDNKYRLDIDFFADGRLSTFDEIVADFGKWLRAEIKRKKIKMRIGRAAKVEQAAYPLKCLAAFRLRHAGFTYEAATDALQAIALTKEDAWFIPCFENAKSWTQAIQFAENRLAEINS
jgi:hypothetical protein